MKKEKKIISENFDSDCTEFISEDANYQKIRGEGGGGHAPRPP